MTDYVRKYTQYRCSIMCPFCGYDYNKEKKDDFASLRFLVNNFGLAQQNKNKNLIISWVCLKCNKRSKVEVETIFSTKKDDED